MRLSIEIDESQHQRIKALAALSGLSLTLRKPYHLYP